MTYSEDTKNTMINNSKLLNQNIATSRMKALKTQTTKLNNTLKKIDNNDFSIY